MRLSSWTPMLWILKPLYLALTSLNSMITGALFRSDAVNLLPTVRCTGDCSSKTTNYSSQPSITTGSLKTECIIMICSNGVSSTRPILLWVGPLKATDFNSSWRSFKCIKYCCLTKLSYSKLKLESQVNSFLHWSCIWRWMSLVVRVCTIMPMILKTRFHISMLRLSHGIITKKLFHQLLFSSVIQ